jgi:hypothetical protein
MHRSRAVTAWQALGATAAVLVTSAALALPATAGTSAPAPRTARPAVTGNFPTWPQAETAAGFALHRPTRLHGLHRAGSVTVRRCGTRGQDDKRIVGAVYGTPASPLLSISENNSGSACTTVDAPFLRNVRIHGVTGQLYGSCLTSCRRNGAFDLIWNRNGTVYEAKAVMEPQHVLLNFARHLHSVA